MQNPSRKKTARSPRFPNIPLKRAQKQLATLADQFGLNFQNVPAIRIFGALGFEVSPGDSGSRVAGSGRANKVLAAHRAYGLLEVTLVRDEQGRKRRLVTLTRRGRKLATLDPQGEKSSLRFLRRAALEPLVFRRVWHRNAPNLTEDELAEALATRGRFTEQGARRAAKVYFANLRFARLDDPDFRKSGDAIAMPAASPDTNQPKNDRTQPPPQLRSVPPSRQEVVAKGPQRLHIPLGESGSAVIPAGLSDEEFQRLMQTLRLWKPALVA